MGLFKVTTTKLEPIPQTTFMAEKMLERKDIQRLLCEDISPISEGIMVIAKEFCDWEDSKRSIDLLCLSRDADLVVIEIKRTEDGGHMELQAIRYAAMVSSMTFETVCREYANLKGLEIEIAKREVFEFLGQDQEEENVMSGDVRIILVSGDFSTEITTSVLWLNRQGLDVKCIRLRPYRVGDDVLIDATQIIPLPEAADYETKIREQQQEKKKNEGERQLILRKFWGQFIERSKEKTQLLANRSATSDSWFNCSIGRSGFFMLAALTKHENKIACGMLLNTKEQNKEAYAALFSQKEEIENKFGSSLSWNDSEENRGRSISISYPGGWKTPEAEWPELQNHMIDTFIRLMEIFTNPIMGLSL